jgi:hypothetical protein
MRAARRRIPPAKAGNGGRLDTAATTAALRWATLLRVFGAGSSVVERGNNGLAIHSLTPGFADAPSRQSRGFARLILWIRDCKIGETSGPRLEPLAVLLVDRCGILSKVARGGSGSSQRLRRIEPGEFSHDSGPRAHVRGLLEAAPWDFGTKVTHRFSDAVRDNAQAFEGGNSKCKADCLSQLPGDGNKTNRDVS